MTKDDIDQAVRLIAVGIEAGLMRDGFPDDTPCVGDCDYATMIPVEWTPATFAEERARNIVMALQGEFELRRLPADGAEQRVERCHVCDAVVYRAESEMPASSFVWCGPCFEIMRTDTLNAGKAR